MKRTGWMIVLASVHAATTVAWAADAGSMAKLLGMTAPYAMAGVESSGNTDGFLTWRIGTLAAGKSAREVVLFAFDASHEKVTARLDAARRAFAQPADRSAAAAEPASKAPVAWIQNAATNFALDPAGCFFWEGVGQSLTGPKGGQLSRLGYYVHYNDGTARRAGTRIDRKGVLENLRIVSGVRAVGETQAAGVVETADGRLRIDIRATMGTGAVAALEFVFTNIGGEPVDDLRLSVYANLEAAHDPGNDYSVLDASTDGLLVVDPPTRTCVVMAGLHPCALGHSGRWPSQHPLENATGVARARWKPFTEVSPKLLKRLARAATPHAPAPRVDPTEPETRTLSAKEAAAVLERDWIFQADGKPSVDRSLAEIRWARELADRLAQQPGPPDLTPERDALGRLERQLKALASPSDETVRRVYLRVRRVKRRIAFKNAVVDFSSVLFIDNPYPQGAEWPHQARHRNGMMAMPGGRLLVLDGVLSPAGTLRKLAPDKPGSFWRPDLSFNAERVLYCYKAHDEKSFHLYEVNLDGTGRRQLTTGDYDDLDPIYLPDGRIMFTTTRGNTYVRCMPYTYSYVLARCDADGDNLYLISQNNEPDWCPTLLHDGRVIYSRWEYTDKALWRIESMWTTNQDGTNTAVFWGNQSVWPDHLAEARPIPGSERVMFTGVAHHNWFNGSIGIIDPRKGFNFPHGLTKVTCDVDWPECGKPPEDPHESDHYHASGHYTAYKTPYPLSEEDFLVSARAEDGTGKFRLYLMDVYGNRELIYEGAYNIWHALPVRPRRRPPVQPDRVAWPDADRKDIEPGILFSPDIYEGVPELTRGSVKYLRVFQLDAKTASSWTRDARFSGPAVSALQEDGVKRILGTVPVEADGSVNFKVPAGRALHFQALDEHYRALQTMRTFTGVMPGERRGCIGCHEQHSTAPPQTTGLALRHAPRELDPPPWGTKTISYTRFVQPVLDRYCGDCHQGDGQARKDLDLTFRPGRGPFTEPYLTLVGPARYGPGPTTKFKEGQVGIAGALMCENYEQSDPRSYVTAPPMQHLSCKSKLVDYCMSGGHYDVKVDPVSLRQVIAWVDANCPYRGEEDIRAIEDPRFAGVDLLPIRPRCKTAPIIARP